MTFFGNNYFTQEKFEELKAMKFNEKNIIELFSQFPTNYQNQQLQDIYISYLIHLFKFALDNIKEQRKIRCLIELSSCNFEKSMKNGLTFDQSYEQFKGFLIQNSVQRPPHSEQIFDLQDIKQISDYFLNTFYQYYSMYTFAFTPQKNVKIQTFEMFNSQLPEQNKLNNGEQINPQNISALREYLIDKEIGLTPKELEEIMKGDSIHNVPLKKREEWLRQKQEREKQQKIDKIIQKELEKLKQEFETKLSLQDEDFLKKVEEAKTAKK